MSSYCETSPSKTPSSPWKAGIHFFLFSSTNSHVVLDEEVPRSYKWSATDTIITDVLDVPFTNLTSSAVVPNNDVLSLYDLARESEANKDSRNGCSREKNTSTDPIANGNEADTTVQNIFENVENRVPQMLQRKRQSAVESFSKKNCRACSSTIVRQRSASLSIQCSERNKEEESNNVNHHDIPHVPCFSCVIGRQSSCLTSSLGQDKSISRALFKLSAEVAPQATFLCPPNCRMEQNHSMNKEEPQTVHNAEEDEILRRASSPFPVEVSPSLVLPLDTCPKRRDPLPTVTTSPPGVSSSPSTSTVFLPPSVPSDAPARHGVTCTSSDVQGCFSLTYPPSFVSTVSLPLFPLPRLQCEILTSTSLVTIVRRDGRIEAPEESDACPQKTSYSVSSLPRTALPLSSRSSSSRVKAAAIPTSSSPHRSRIAQNSPSVSISPYFFSSFLHPSSFSASDSSAPHRPRWNVGYRTWIDVGDVIEVKGVRLELGAFVWIHQEVSHDKAEEEKHKKEKCVDHGAGRQGKSHLMITADEALRYCGVRSREHSRNKETVGELSVVCTIPHPLYGIPWMATSSTSTSADIAKKVSSSNPSGVLPLLPFYRVEWLKMSPWTRQQLLVHYWNAWCDATAAAFLSDSAEPFFSLTSSSSRPFTTRDIPRLQHKRKRTSSHLSPGSFAPCLSTAVTSRSPCRQSSLPSLTECPSASDTWSISPTRSCQSESNERTVSCRLRGDKEEEENTDYLRSRRNTRFLVNTRSKAEEEKNSEEDAATPSSQWPEEELLFSSSECYHKSRRVSSCIPSSLSNKENEEGEMKRQTITVRDEDGAAITPRKVNAREKNKVEEGEQVHSHSIRISTPPCLSVLNLPRYTSFTRRDSSSGRESLMDATSLFQHQLDVLLGERDSSSHYSTPLRNRPTNSLAVGISRTSTNLGEGDYTQGSQQQQTGVEGGLEYAGKMVQESVDVCYFD